MSLILQLYTFNSVIEQHFLNDPSWRVIRTEPLVDDQLRNIDQICCLQKGTLDGNTVDASRVQAHLYGVAFLLFLALPALFIFVSSFLYFLFVSFTLSFLCSFFFRGCSICHRPQSFSQLYCYDEVYIS